MSIDSVSELSFKERLVDEAAAIVAAGERAGFPVRVMGGIGIRLLLGSRLDRAFERPIRDIDLIVRKRDARPAEQLIADRGWTPAREFNMLNGSRRLLFHDPHSEAQVDVFVGAFEMAHTLPLGDDLSHPGPALPATDLLMTKLQIVELNAKDRTDLYALLSHCEVRDGDHTAIEPARVADLTARDWGLHHTFELNLQRLHDGIAEGALAAGGAAATVGRAVDAIREAMDSAPKTRGWKMRARVGERKRWYEEPEEVDRD
jgi:hypothetical protein